MEYNLKVKLGSKRLLSLSFIKFHLASLNVQKAKLKLGPMDSAQLIKLIFIQSTKTDAVLLSQTELCPVEC